MGENKRACAKILAGMSLTLLSILVYMAAGQPHPGTASTAPDARTIQSNPQSRHTDEAIPPFASILPAPAQTPAPIRGAPKIAASQKNETEKTSDAEIPAAAVQQEQSTSDPEAGKWMYSGPELDVTVTRERNEEAGFTYYLADIRIRDMNAVRTGFAGENPWNADRKHPARIAKEYGAVLAINGDFFTASENKKGISIRNGTIYYDKKQRADTLAILPDGTMRVYKPDETTAAELQAAGIQNTLTFGPALVDGGQINPDLRKNKLYTNNPRTGIGMISPKHYIAVVVQGRGWEKSRGINLDEFAAVFLARGCTVAYNLDGGQSTAMIFMGETLNKHNKTSTGIVFRSVPEVLIFGITEEETKKV